MKVFYQLFSSSKSKSNWFIYIAISIGCLLLLLSFQLFLNVNQLMNGSQQVSDGFEYLVVNKKITNAMMGNHENSFFTQQEIQDLKSQKTISEIAFITSNNYGIQAQALGQLAFSTQLFFESLPDQYLDIKPKDWKWNSTNQTIPILLSSEYLNLYNFGFALSQGLPQMSEETIQAIPFNITIYDKNHEANYTARIVGFTHRYSSILVPIEFMNYCNTEFGSNQPKSISRIVIQTKEADHPDLVKYLSDHSYATQNEKLKSSKLKSIVNMVFAIAIVLGLFILVLSLFLLLFYIKLLIIKSSKTLQLLFMMGYQPIKLQREFLKNEIKPILILIFISILLIALGQYLLSIYLNQYSIQISSFISWQTILLAFLFLLGIYLLLRWRLRLILNEAIKH